jgi:dienelactone hydrolase
MSVEPVEFEVGGETYEGRLNSRREDADTGVLVVPGMGHGPFGDIFDVVAYELAGTGKQVFRYESWEASEDLEEKTLAELHAELDAAVEYLRSKGCSTVYLVAKSFGGGLVLTHLPGAVERVVLWEPATIEVGDDPNVEAVADEPFGDVEEYVVGPAQLGRIDVPVRVLSGDRERSVDREHCERIADAVQDGAVTTVRGEDHSFNRNRTATVGHTLAYLSDGR